MKVSTTSFLALVLGGLGLYYFSTGKSVTAPTGELSPVEIMLLAPGDKVAWLRVENLRSKEKVALRREESGWSLAEPVSYPVEDLLARGMVAALSRVQRLRRFSFKGRLPKGLGLENPQMRIGVETAQAANPRVLLLGGESPIGGTFYARWEDEEEYFLVPAEFKAAFERSAYSLRRKKLFRVNWEEVTWIETRTRQRLYRLERNGNVWRGVLGAEQKEIPLEKMNDLIYAFQSLYIKDFLDGKNPANHEFRLREKQNYFAVGGRQGALFEKLVTGAPARGKDAFYVLREKENLVLLVSEANLKSLGARWEGLFGGFGKTKNDPGKSGTGAGAGPKGLREGASAGF